MPSNDQHDQLLTPDQVADYLQIGTGHLANCRSRGTSPIPYVRVGNRIRYRQSDVHAYIEARTVNA
ncbi:helix-turn-helix domain-containing protein [Flexivirga oryzae]|uniref:Excisionase family DNA binding protein n=1 Tax=Flexivirga oryzae TaxID=1794944 RepID=A0A839N4X9_9MICO|nr:helix-turn-helix domain-containing protein [Flexivirga oryzae]MBB2891124.1 excisionase family DNA binding protein [Flexivirga oryzae]